MKEKIAAAILTFIFSIVMLLTVITVYLKINY